MEGLLVIASGLMFAAGLYLMLSGQLVKIIIGLMLLGHGINFMIFMSGGLRAGKPAFINQDTLLLNPNASDPLPQALVLTAIVIGFAITAYIILLFQRLSKQDMVQTNPSELIE